MSSSLGRLSWLRSAAMISVSSGIHHGRDRSAVPWQRLEIDGGRRRANEGTPAGSSVSLVEMTWTSISSSSRRTREMTA